MKKLLVLVLFGLLFLSCNKIKVDVDNTFNEELSEFVSTKASEPLEGTVWEYKSNDKFNKYLYFNEGKVNLFYGEISEDNVLERWSDFYVADYTLKNGMVVTDLQYPLWGKMEKTESVTIVKAEDIFTINVNGEMYEYVVCDISQLDWMWMYIYVGIKPWE